jgi:hypothetical protein
VERRVLQCSGDDDCVEALGPGWVCDASADWPPVEPALNGSIKTRCSRTCEEDEECKAEFCGAQGCPDSATPCDRGQQGCAHKCVALHEGDETRFCDDRTASCDAAKEGWPEWACCVLARIGSPETPSYQQLPSGLAAAWSALDPDGANSGEAAKFLRPDATLLLVFVAVRDDCSIHEDYGVLSRAYYTSCPLMEEFLAGTHTAKFSLAWVNEFAERFQSLKASADQVRVAVIVPDGLPLLPEPLVSQECREDTSLAECAALEAEGQWNDDCEGDPSAPGCEQYVTHLLGCIRECFLASYADIHDVSHYSYVCEYGAGTGEFGARYMRLADQFGKRGKAFNLCSVAGHMSEALTEMAAFATLAD